MGTVAALNQKMDITGGQHRVHVLRELIRDRALLTDGPYKLASGVDSPYLFDLKRLTLDRKGMHVVAHALAEALSQEPAEYLGGIELGAVPVIIEACMVSNRHALIVRKKTKERGTNQLVEGNYAPGSEVIVVDDVTTSGSSVLRAVEALKGVGCIVRKVYTIVDRQEGAAAALKKHGIELCPLLLRSEFIEDAVA